MILAFAFAIALTPPVPSPAQPVPIPVDFPLAGGPAVGWPGGASVNVLSNLPLSDEARQVFDTDFQASGYFGAFAISKEQGYGYSSGVASLDAARDIALAQCQSLNGRCTVIAELLPQGYTPPAPGIVTLSQQIYGHFVAAAKNPDFQALAVSEDGAFAMYWGLATPEEADSAALADCETNRERDLAGLRDMPCVLVHNLP